MAGSTCSETRDSPRKLAAWRLTSRFVYGGSRFGKGDPWRDVRLSSARSQLPGRGSCGAAPMAGAGEGEGFIYFAGISLSADVSLSSWTTAVCRAIRAAVLRPQPGQLCHRTSDAISN